MSGWDGWLASLKARGNFDKTAIWGYKGGFSCWAMDSDYFNFQDQSQLKAIVDSFSDTSDVKKVQSEGFAVKGDKFVTLRSDDERLYGRKKGPDPANKEGVLIFKTPQAIIIGHYHAGVEPGNAVNDLENLGGHLAKSQ